MRRNTVTYWTTADFANRETCSLIRLNDAFRKTLLQVAKKKTRKLTDHGKQLLPRALISNVIGCVRLGNPDLDFQNLNFKI